MNFEWRNKQNNANLIVFFSGWGSDKNINLNLKHNNFDILIIFNYKTFESINFDFSNYTKKYLIAWSMGVFVCNYYYETFKDFDKLIAINGTQSPIDDNYGISQNIYDLTIKNFNELSCSKFIKKMSPNLSIDKYCTRTIEDLKNELISIKNLKISNFLTFNKSIISLKDRIIPAKNQINWWQNRCELIEQLENTHHYIFDNYTNWSDLI
ncbi:DUF452 family protein [bacterium]|nr:DUF452 family protein [bacterium]